MDVWRIEFNMVRPHQVLEGRFDKPNVSRTTTEVEARASQLWGFKSEEGLAH
jgi:hypothetical protein